MNDFSNNNTMNSTLQFFVKEPSLGKTLVFNLTPHTTLKDFLEKITDKTGWPSKYFFLTQNAKHINTYSQENLYATLNDLHIKDDYTIICHPRVCCD